MVLDRSGSMMSLKDDMEGGLWATITEQHRQPGRCRVSLYQFDDVWEPVWEAKTPSGAISADDCRLVPRGSTALHDAVVKSLAGDRGPNPGRARAGTTEQGRRHRDHRRP